MKKLILVAATLFAGSTFAAPEKRIVIEMGQGGEHYRGGQSLPLRRMIKAQHPNIRLENFELLRVRVVGKSKNGNGSASLSVGPRTSYPVYLNGNRQDFHVNAPYTWDRQVIQNPKNNSNGPWKINLQGNIKIKRIVAILEREVIRPPRRTQASCRVKLETLWGSDIKEFHATSFGRTQRQAKDNACAEAMQQCRSSRLNVKITKCSVK
ncbi:MAG: hypothetical protein ACJAT2_002532 [Bacteriovoracaceae bacterium]|jgi:hypothetical protein